MAFHRRLIAALGTLGSSAAAARDQIAGQKNSGPTDYADASNWMFIDRHPVQKADVFYIYPTVCLHPTEDGGIIAGITGRMKEDARCEYDVQGSAFADYCSVFAPYYRQVSFDAASQIKDHDAYLDMLRSSESKTDIFAAIDYYFKNLNQGRPFILAGYAEGSALLMLVLEEYMKEHPDYYKNMVAAYVIGFGVTQDWLDANPHLKFAAGKTDTGGIISWNTEAPGASKPNVVLGRNTRVINPVLWTTDETYADKSLNKGSIVSADHEKAVRSRIVVQDTKSVIKAGLHDAQINRERGTLICTTCPENVIPESAFDGLFGDGSLHTEDYANYYQNIRVNGYDRITAFLGYQPLVGRALPYSLKVNWMFQDTEAKYAVDLFYVYPTVDMGHSRTITGISPGIAQNADGRNIIRIETTTNTFRNVSMPTKEVRDSAKTFFAKSGGVFVGITNIFVPYYRQSPIDRIVECAKHNDSIDILRASRARTDMFAALDYYFRNLNRGRPFILAGHSQGSAMLQIVLDDYMKQHPEYYKNMVAAYVIGYGTEEAWFDKNPHLKFAEGETDTGVIISWNTEGPGAQQYNMLIGDNARVINPLNWKTDETYADKSLNKGSLGKAADGTPKITAGLHDAQIDSTRHALICTTDTKYMTDRAGVEFVKMFGEKSLHNSDYRNYFVNIRENCQKRIDAFLAKM